VAQPSEVVIDGSYGEGGGQVLRTSLALAAMLGTPLRIVNIRAKRRVPGLQAQHLTGVLAAAQVCSARAEGATLGSTTLAFIPQSPPRAGDYFFDVAEARKGGSAGAASLVFQTVLLPLALADGPSLLTIRGGTHVPWSPPFHYLERVYLPIVARMSIEAGVEIEKWGWYPIGGGEMTAKIQGTGVLSPLNLIERGKLVGVSGLSAVANLPRSIAERQRRRAEEMLRAEGINPAIELIEAPAQGQGTVVFLAAEYEHMVAGFTALGERGKPAERVAEEVCRDLLAYHRSGAALDMHLADQLILPMALAKSRSAFTTCRVTPHLLTNAWVVERFLGPKVKVEGSEGKKGKVIIDA
jgi:RNA 3'-terminal phosphate cyclase (ATP)